MRKPPTWNQKVPFDLDGNLLHYPDPIQERQGHVVWKERFEFDATLTFIKAAKEKSAAYVWLKDEKGNQYPMSLHEFSRLVPYFEYGILGGHWKFVKRGQNFFIEEV